MVKICLFVLRGLSDQTKELTVLEIVERIGRYYWLKHMKSCQLLFGKHVKIDKLLQWKKEKAKTPTIDRTLSHAFTITAHVTRKRVWPGTLNV